VNLGAVEHGAELRRCLIAADVAGLIKLWAHISPHLADQSPAQALLALHMARCEAKYISLKLKAWSKAFLADHGIQKIDGRWTEGLPNPVVIAESVGIASRSVSGRVLPFNRKVMTSMDGALQNARAKGVTEAPMQREAMLKAREKVRFKARLA
jgi:hypothetical protein